MRRQKDQNITKNNDNNAFSMQRSSVEMHDGNGDRQPKILYNFTVKMEKEHKNGINVA